MIIKFLKTPIYVPYIFSKTFFSYSPFQHVSVFDIRHETFCCRKTLYSSLKYWRSTLCDAKSLESDVEAGASSRMLIQVCFCETPNGRKHDLLSLGS